MSRVLDHPSLGRGPHALGASRNQVLARDLARAAPTIEESCTGGAVLELCAAHPAGPSFAVIEGKGKVIGLIERERSITSSRNRSRSTSITAARSRPWLRARRWWSTARCRSKA
jgi:hypothetical protein